MEIKIEGSTKMGHMAPLEDALKTSAAYARICYSAKDFEKLENEDPEGLLKTQNDTLEKGHHSVYGHISYNLYLKEAPKIMAMVLNNEKVYNTSEKSARYTVMKMDDEERKMFGKWQKAIESRIISKYPFIDEKAAAKLANENARYFISVFTPATKMGYTASLLQINYLMHWFREFIENAPATGFNSRLKPFMAEFNRQLEPLYVEKLDPKIKIRKLSLFSECDVQEHFGHAYSANYTASFSSLAQLHRHRTIAYTMKREFSNGFFVPPILEEERLKEEWLADMKSFEGSYPQGMLLKINERSTYENFISRAAERQCGRAQLETMLKTKELMDRYLAATKDTNRAVYDALLPYSQAKCLIPDFKCKEPCNFRAKSLERLI